MVEKTLTEQEKKNYALVEIERLLSNMGKQLSDFYAMPVPDSEGMSNVINRLIHEELSYDLCVLERKHDILVCQLTDEQRCVYDTVLDDVYN